VITGRSTQASKLQQARRVTSQAASVGPTTLATHVRTGYKRIQEFLRTSKQFGAQRQASAKRAAGIALDNLARTAGYADPIRLEWAMEATAVADLAAGPVGVKVDEVTVSLGFDGLGQPDLSVTRAG